MNLSWGANPYAQTVRSAGVYTFDAGGVVNQGGVAVTRGATTATATGPVAVGATAPTPFPALTADGVTSRAIQIRYRMLDGAYKDSFTRYN
jgi:adhesin HecA-like repeat protein